MSEQWQDAEDAMLTEVSVAFLKRQSKTVRDLVGLDGLLEAYESGEMMEETPDIIDVTECATADEMDAEGNIACIVENTILYGLRQQFTPDSEIGLGENVGYADLIEPIAEDIGCELHTAEMQDPEQQVDGDVLVRRVEEQTVERWLGERFPALYRLLDAENLGLVTPSTCRELLTEIAAMVDELRAAGVQLERSKEEEGVLPAAGEDAERPFLGDGEHWLFAAAMRVVQRRQMAKAPQTAKPKAPRKTAKTPRKTARSRRA